MNTLLKLIIGGITTKLVVDRYRKQNKTPQRRIFISHSWKKGSDDYISLINKLNNADIPFYNHSIPIDRAFDENKKKELEKIFRRQMVYCSKVFVLATRGVKKNTFVMMEIKIAKSLKKEIIAVKPHGQKGIPDFIRKNSNMIISNNINSIKKALK
ncbi:TIR domain-containing protein [Aquimarina sp. AU119]|uniref:TIR domain-containing protein n=1 Tax=Aquimarina sp. AU119 TaxID=2108528 RepID=UPI000D697C08|nr:TIR domain-containing protein [Aquimarina sp. AU119]